MPLVERIDALEKLVKAMGVIMTKQNDIVERVIKECEKLTGVVADMALVMAGLPPKHNT